MWKVQVNLEVLATNLRHRYGDYYDEYKAAKWLTQEVYINNVHCGYENHNYRGLEKSPFAPAAEWGFFYTVERPDLWLCEGELVGETPLSEMPRASTVNMAWRKYGKGAAV